MYAKKTGLRHALARVLIILLVLALPAGLAGPAVAAEPAPAAAAPVAPTPPPPIDEEDAFNRELVQDIVDHAEDVEVRDAARAALATNDPAKIREYLDTGDALARKAAADRTKRVAADNRALVTDWSKTAGPIARQRALDVLGTNDDKKIADFVAFGKDLADAQDRNTVEDAAAKAERIKARVTDMVARGGPEVKAAGQAAVDSGDPAVIEKFVTTGYTEANKRDGEARAAIEAAQAARNKALQDLQDLADRSARASNARTQILKSSVQAVKSLTDASTAMGLGNQAAKRADQIFEEDKPGRPAGKRGRAAELAGLTAEAKRQLDGATAAARETSIQAGLSDAAAQQLKDTGLTHGIDWAQVSKAIAAASQAAVKAAETAWHAAEATEAASLALDADANARVHADNAARWRLAAEDHAAAAAAIAEATRLQAGAAADAAARTKQARAEAERAERQAWAAATRTRDARAVAEREARTAAAARARAQQEARTAAGARAQAQAQAAFAATARGNATRLGQAAEAAEQVAAREEKNAVDASGRAIDAERAQNATLARAQALESLAASAASGEAGRRAPRGDGSTQRGHHRHGSRGTGQSSGHRGDRRRGPGTVGGHRSRWRGCSGERRREQGRVARGRDARVRGQGQRRRRDRHRRGNPGRRTRPRRHPPGRAGGRGGRTGAARRRPHQGRGRRGRRGVCCGRGPGGDRRARGTGGELIRGRYRRPRRDHVNYSGDR